MANFTINFTFSLNLSLAGIIDFGVTSSKKLMGISLSKNDPKGVDKISNLPSGIIEIILCLVPIKEAVRTSILSKDWRYNWAKITKLVFHQEHMPDKTTDEFFYAIHRVLLQHPGPIFEFSLFIWDENGEPDKIDQIITHLVQKNNHTVKKFTLRLPESRSYSLPLSISLLHHLTDLCVSGVLICDPPLSGFGSLTSLYVKGDIDNRESFLHILSNCPLLKHVKLEPYEPRFIMCNKDAMIIDLFKCLPVIERLTIDSDWLWFKCDRVPATAFIHLKYVCVKEVLPFDNTMSDNLVFIIRSSPNLENIKIEINDKYSYKGIRPFKLESCSDIWLDHLQKLEIRGFRARNGEMEFVKLILAKSPVLMKARIILSKCLANDDELQIERLLLGSPRVSPLAELIVERQGISMRVVGPRVYHRWQN